MLVFNMSKIGRNDPCFCGSGKKYKKCCINKKSRKEEIYIGHHKQFSCMDFDKDSGQIYIVQDGQRIKPDNIFSRTCYEKAIGQDKVISQITGSATFNVESFLREQYDLIIAIDTNSKAIRGDKISVCSILECKVEGDLTEIKFKVRINAHFIFKDCPDGQEEKHSWFQCIKAINPDLASKKIAIITDHDAINHWRYNNRDTAIYGDFYLPPNITLLYASSDKNDNIMNKLISRCDKDAKLILNMLDKDGYAIFNGRRLEVGQIKSVC